MNAKQFSDAMDEIDSKYIDEVLSYNKKASEPRHFRRLPFALIAAILALLLMGCAVAAANIFGTQLVEFFTSRMESGYDLGVSIEKIPMDDFTGDIQEVGERIKQQFQNYKVFDSWYPGHWQTTFSTRDKAYEYIGLDKLKQIDWDYKEQMTTLNVFGNSQGQILSVNLETFYMIDDMNVQFSSRIYAESYEEEFILATRTTGNIGFKESFYTTHNNKQCHMISSSALESGTMCLEGYLVDAGVLYHLHIVYTEDHATQAIELMHQWANLF